MKKIIMMLLVGLTLTNAFTQSTYAQDNENYSAYDIINAVDEITTKAWIGGLVTAETLETAMVAHRMYVFYQLAGFGMYSEAQLTALAVFFQNAPVAATTVEVQALALANSATTSAGLAAIISKRQAVTMILRGASRFFGVVGAAFLGWEIGRILDNNFPGGVPLSDLIGDGLCEATDCDGQEELGIERTNRRGFY